MWVSWSERGIVLVCKVSIPARNWSSKDGCIFQNRPVRCEIAWGLWWCPFCWSESNQRLSNEDVPSGPRSKQFTVVQRLPSASSQSNCKETTRLVESNPAYSISSLQCSSLATQDPAPAPCISLPQMQHSTGTLISQVPKTSKHPSNILLARYSVLLTNILGLGWKRL